MMKHRLSIITACIFSLLAVLLVRHFQAGRISAAEDAPKPEELTPLPTVQIPTELKDALEGLILKAVNVSLTETEDTSMGPSPRLAGPALFDLRAHLVSEALTELNSMKDDAGIAVCGDRLRGRLKEATERAEARYLVAANSAKHAKFSAPVEPSSIKLHPVEGQPDLVALEMAADVNCGSDASVQLFQRGQHGYHLAVGIMNTAMDVTGYEDLHYKVSPANEAGERYVVATHGQPWCTSCWGGLHISVWRLRPGGKAGEKIFEDGVSIYRCGGSELTVKKDGFGLSYTSWQGLDGDVLTRVTLWNYAFDGASLRRVGPLANFPEDFVDEWIHMPEKDAERFASPGLGAWKARLKASHGYEGFKFVQACPGKEGKWEVGISTDKGDLPESIYFEVHKKNGDFFMNEIRTERIKGCPGETPPQAHPVNMG